MTFFNDSKIFWLVSVSIMRNLFLLSKCLAVVDIFWCEIPWRQISLKGAHIKLNMNYCACVEKFSRSDLC